jgi:hypothetical protein
LLSELYPLIKNLVLDPFSVFLTIGIIALRFVTFLEYAGSECCSTTSISSDSILCMETNFLPMLVTTNNPIEC